MSATSLWGSIVWFVVIVATIPAALWLLKRTPIGGAASQAGLMRSVGALPLSTNQRVVTVEVGQGAARRWLVLGVTPQSITTLYTLEPQAEPAATDAPATPPTFAAAFAQVLAKRRSGRGAGR